MKILEFNVNWFGKIKSKTKQMSFLLIFINFWKTSKNLNIQYYQKHYDELYKPLQIENNNIQQKYPCYTLAFSNDDNLLFTGCGNQIKVWNFYQGKIKEITRLNGHTLTVTCIVTSKTVKNSFVSGSECGQLIIWKQKTEKEWESLNKKSKWINSIILNYDETQLILATSIHAIQIWYINFNQNQLAFNYSLQVFHNQAIFDLCLNKSENRMISCSDDNKIIIWKKDQEDLEWQLYQEIKQINYGTKVAFISDSSFICIDCNSEEFDTLQIYQLQNEKYILNFRNFYKFEKDASCIDFNLTPIIYNNKRNIFFIRFKRHIYILKLEDSGFQLITKLKFQSNLIFATLSEDAKYLITYLEDKQNYQVHKIKW